VADSAATPAHLAEAQAIAPVVCVQSPHVLVIPGTGSVTHLEENVAAAGLSLTPEQLATL
jgi:pyridoxine 4-dehydrogenase